MASTDTARQAQPMELLKKEVRAILIAAKEGLTPAELEEQYMAIVCKPLPLQDLGFQSTLELVTKMPEVVHVSFCRNGTVVLKAIADDSTKGIAKLVACQKGRTCRKTPPKANAASLSKNSKNPQCFPLRARTPVLPATVKAELQDLLSSSPLLLQDLDKAFLSGFGRAFPYRQYGFSSALEALRSVSDLVVVEQTKAGSLLVLRQNLANEAEQEEVPQGEAQDEETLQAEMPPLEPVCETDDLYQTALQKKCDPVETQAADLGDGLKQPQDFQPLLPSKLTVTVEIPPDAVQDRSLCSLPPLKRKCLVGVVVEFIVSPTQFYAHICSRETSYKLQDLMFEMRHLYSHKLVSDKYIMPDSAVRPGQLCCAMVSKWWYRVIIHRVISDQEVEVFYADYGHLQVVQKSWLRFLKWHYLKLPAQAIPCSLAWVKPVEGTWSPAATLLFKNLCRFKELVGIVDEYVDGVLHLFLCDTSTKEDVYFHSVLRDMGYADVCGENIPSQEFKELNPLALYVQPSGKQENDELVEPDFCLQQESLVADSETTASKWDGAELCEQTPHSLGESSVPAILVKPEEDLYTSFIYSKQPAEMRQDDPDQIERFYSKAQLSEAADPAVLPMAVPIVLDTPNTTGEENLKTFPGVGLCRANLTNSMSLLPHSLQCWQLHDWPLPVAPQPGKAGVRRGEKLELLPKRVAGSSAGSLDDHAVGFVFWSIFFCSQTFNPLKNFLGLMSQVCPGCVINVNFTLYFYFQGNTLLLLYRWCTGLLLFSIMVQNVLSVTLCYKSF